VSQELRLEVAIILIDVHSVMEAATSYRTQHTGEAEEALPQHTHATTRKAPGSKPVGVEAGPFMPAHLHEPPIVDLGKQGVQEAPDGHLTARPANPSGSNSSSEGGESLNIDRLIGGRCAGKASWQLSFSTHPFYFWRK
jgi:hypothetical protein